MVSSIRVDWFHLMTFPFPFHFSTRDYTHVLTRSDTAAQLDPNLISEIIYPQGRILLTRKDRTLMLQNTTFSVTPSPPITSKKKRKRALVQVSLPQSTTQQRFFDDGSHETVTAENSSSASVMCKVSITETEDGGQEVNLSFTSSTPPPHAPATAPPVEDPRKKDKKVRKLENVKADKEIVEGGAALEQ